MARKPKSCSGCGGGDFQVFDDGSIACRNCGSEFKAKAEAKPETTYSRGTKVEGGTNSFLEGLGSFLLFESLGGGCVAGFIVLVLVVGGLIFALIFFRNRGNDGTPSRRQVQMQKAEEEKLSRSMQYAARAADAVQRESRKQGRILHQDEANAKMTPRNDGWGRPFVYEVVDDDTFVIRCIGKDRKPNTEDDFVERRKLTLEKKPAKTSLLYGTQDCVGPLFLIVG